MKIHRQGDVLLKPCSALPKGAVKITNKPLALGEVTGHSHRLTGEGYEMYELEGKTYLQVLQPSPLIHEEHHEQVILPGTYEQIAEREYSYEDEELKSVVD